MGCSTTRSQRTRNAVNGFQTLSFSPRMPACFAQCAQKKLFIRLRAVADHLAEKI